MTKKITSIPAIMGSSMTITNRPANTYIGKGVVRASPAGIKMPKHRPWYRDIRRDLGRVVHQEGENAKIAIRNIRRDANKHIDGSEKDKVISEDDTKRYKDDIQELTKKFETKVNEMAETKETEVMED